MSNEHMNELVGRVRETYHVPPEPPREQMWAAIAAGLRDTPDVTDDPAVIDLAEARERRALTRHPLAWVAAAAALVVLGIGIGRMSAPGVVVAPVVAAETDGTVALTVAALEHLGRTESLLTMVRAEARGGALEPATAEWAQGLLSETRLFIDAREGGDPALTQLFEDLELILVQIVGIAEAGSGDEAWTRTELQLAMSSLEDGEVLPRIQAALPEGLAGA